MHAGLRGGARRTRASVSGKLVLENALSVKRANEGAGRLNRGAGSRARCTHSSKKTARDILPRIKIFRNTEVQRTLSFTEK